MMVDASMIKIAMKNEHGCFGIQGFEGLHHQTKLTGINPAYTLLKALKLLIEIHFIKIVIVNNFAFYDRLGAK
jgi:hypothetical protein